jgi:hypothetical protein
VVIRSLFLPLSGRGLKAEPRLPRVRGVPLADQALSVGETVSSQQACNPVLSLRRLQEGYDAITSTDSRNSPDLNASPG